MELTHDERERSPFDKLPVQVVEHIFLKGCEMEMPKSEYEIFIGTDYFGYRSPISRRLKPFALDIRGVCSEWKNRIDSEENFSLTRYWFASLILVIPSYSISRRTDQGEKRENVSFAKQMLHFRSQLASSRGCDLYVSLFSFKGMEKWDDSMDLYSETGIMVRLMAYALVDLKKYSKQIVKFSVDSDEPHMVLNTMVLLSMTPRGGSRLSELGFRRISGLEVPESLMKTELDALWRRTEDPFRSSTLLDFSHLTNLDTLEAGNSSWLSGSLQLPIGISRVHMWQESRSMSWLKAFTRRQLHTFANISYLAIIEDIEDTSDRDPEVIKWLSQSGTSGQLIFPMLRTLDLATLDTNGADFIRHASFPKLESVYLNLEAGEEVMTQNIETSPILAIPLPFLVELRAWLPYSWTSLTTLKAFISHPIQLGHIRIDEGFNKVQLTPGFVDSLRNTLSMLQPVELELAFHGHSIFRFLLGAINLKLLQTLNIEGYKLELEKSPLHEHNKNPTIKVPNLTYLSLKGIHVEKCIYLLTNLSAINLERLEIDISVRSEDIIESLTSSGKESLHGENDNFISLDKMPGPLYTENFGLHGEEALVKVLYESLGPDSAERVKFPKLTSSQFSLEFDNSMYAQKDTVVLGLKHCLRRVLKSRSKNGVTQLMLREAIQVKVINSHKDGDRPFQCNFRLLRRRGGEAAIQKLRCRRMILL